MCTYRMRHSIEHRDRINLKDYECLSFAKNMGKNLSSKYGQKLLGTTKKSQQQMHSKLLQKEYSSRQQKQLVI